MSSPRAVIHISTPLTLEEMSPLYHLNGMPIAHDPLPLGAPVLLRIATGNHGTQISLAATVVASEDGVVRVACRSRQQVISELLRCRRLDRAVVANDDDKHANKGSERPSM